MARVPAGKATTRTVPHAMNGSARAGRLERLSPLDVSNLRVEDHGLPMHVAALAILEGAPLLDASGQPRLDLLREHLQRRLPLAPRLRQVLLWPPIGLGAPVWVDDAGFDLRQHLQTRAVPAPGGEAALLELCAELNEVPLDRSRPLWQLWVLTGLADDKIGLLLRLHHVVADGIAALALLGALFDTTPDPPAPAAQPWTPGPAPSGWQLLADNLQRHRAVLTGARSAVQRPGVLLDRLWWLARKAGPLARLGLARPVSLNRPVGNRRRLALVRADLGRAKAVAHAHRATVNDVVLAAVAGGARRLLQARGELRPGLVLNASVAASIRRPAEAHAGGNRVGILLVPLPVDEPDPICRLAQLAQATAEAKRRPVYQPSGRLLQRWMARAMGHQRLVQLFVSDLPGPPMPLFLAGARVLEVFQVGVIQGNVTLGVGVLSYAGQLNFDLVATSTPSLMRRCSPRGWATPCNSWGPDRLDEEVDVGRVGHCSMIARWSRSSPTSWADQLGSATATTATATRSPRSCETLHPQGRLCGRRSSAGRSTARPLVAGSLSDHRSIRNALLSRPSRAASTLALSCVR